MYWCASLLVAAAVISGNVLADTATEHELLKKEVRAAKPEAGDYEGCLQYSHYLNWYNGNLNIGRIYDLYLNTLSRKTTAPDLHLHAVVEKLKLLFQLQNQMYDVFEEASKQNQYSILFEKLVAVADQRLNAADGEPIKKDTNLKVGEVEDAFRQETLTRLYKFYGQAIIDVENYWNRFFFNAVERPEIQDFAELVKDGSTEEERQRSFYKVMEESEFEPTKLTFENVDAIHYAEVLYYGLEMRVKNVPEVLPEREWEAIPTPNDPDIDFKLKFLELDPTEQAADIGASSSRAESSSRNV